jgi:aspartate carbamoyltransferase catalytic subunit
VVRHAFAGAAEYLSRHVRAAIVNAGDGQHEHPTQALLDAFTIRKAKRTLQRKVITIIGDIRHSRVVRSGVPCFTKLGAHVRVCGPATLIPPGIERLGCTVVMDVEKALKGADVVMCLRIQNERMVEAFVPSTREYAAGWRLDAERLALARPDAIVMHPGPMNRGVEITGDVADSAQSVIVQQVEHGVLVRMAVLRTLVAQRRARVQPRAVSGGRS